MEGSVKYNFKNNLDKFLASVFGLVMGFIQFIYWHDVSSLIPRYIGDSVGNGYWRYSPPGSLFPWPSKPGDIVELNELGTLDQMIFGLYYNGIYILIALSLIFLFILIGLYLGKYFQIKYQFDNAPDHIFPKPKNDEDLEEYGQLALNYIMVIWIIAMLLILVVGFIGLIICIAFGPFLIIPSLAVSLFTRDSSRGRISFVLSLITGIIWAIIWLYIVFNPIYYT